jgi:hypothetical protein
MDATISGLRPRSETALSSTSEMASRPLDTDRDQLLCAGVR